MHACMHSMHDVQMHAHAAEGSLYRDLLSNDSPRRASSSSSRCSMRLMMRPSGSSPARSVPTPRRSPTKVSIPINPPANHQAPRKLACDSPDGRSVCKHRELLLVVDRELIRRFPTWSAGYYDDVKRLGLEGKELTAGKKNPGGVSAQPTNQPTNKRTNQQTNQRINP